MLEFHDDVSEAISKVISCNDVQLRKRYSRFHEDPMDSALMYGPLVRLEHPSNKCPEELVFMKEVKPRFR